MHPPPLQQPCDPSSAAPPTAHPSPSGRPARPPAGHLTLAELMLLVASVGVSLSIFLPAMETFAWTNDEAYWQLAVMFLSGPSWIGPPILLWRRRRDRRRSPGRLMWFVTGTACWAMWPAILAAGVLKGQRDGMARGCFHYVVPLMALFLLASLPIVFPARRTPLGRAPWWGDRFGLFLGYAWAAVGLYVLIKIYLDSI